MAEEYPPTVRRRLLSSLGLFDQIPLVLYTLRFVRFNRLYCTTLRSNSF